MSFAFFLIFLFLALVSFLLFFPSNIFFTELGSIFLSLSFGVVLDFCLLAVCVPRRFLSFPLSCQADHGGVDRPQHFQL